MTLRIATLFEQLGQQPEAKEYFLKYVERARQPEAALELARYLGRQNNLDEALKLCDRAWQTCPAERVAYASVAVLHAGKSGAEHYGRVQEAIERALTRTPGQTGLLLCLADLAELRGQFDQAEEFYRKVLQIDGRNVAALNNLAWLVALRQPRPEEARTLVEGAISILGPIPELIDTRAVVYLALDQPKKAILDLEEAAARPAVEPRVRASVGFHLARAYNAAGKREEAVKALRRYADNLDSGILHPLERDSYTRLRDELMK
jgi:tetratricopeptide (TPR) repeat protein